MLGAGIWVRTGRAGLEWARLRARQSQHRLTGGLVHSQRKLWGMGSVVIATRVFLGAHG